MKCYWIASLAILFGLSERVVAQSLAPDRTLFVIDGPSQAGSLFGRSVVAMGDITDDGIGDFAVGDRDWDDGMNSDVGVVRVYSGRTGQEIFSRVGSPANPKYGLSLSSGGDVNMDGTNDLVVGGTNFTGSDDGYVEVLSGAKIADSTAAGNLVLWSATGSASGNQLGASVAILGDIDADGHADVLVGEPGFDHPMTGTNSIGRARVFSGQSGNPLSGHAHQGSVANETFGLVVAAAGNVDSDSVPDYVIASRNSGSGAGLVVVYSGASGSVITSWTGSAGEALGIDVAGLDYDADTHNDILVGSSSAGSNSGKFTVYSGVSPHSVLLQVSGSGAEGLGATLGAAGDLNQDGFDDLWVSSLGNSPTIAPKLQVYFGGDAMTTPPSPLDLDALSSPQAFRYAAFPGDLNADGAHDIVVGQPSTSGVEVVSQDVLALSSPVFEWKYYEALNFGVQFEVGAKAPGTLARFYVMIGSVTGITPRSNEFLYVEYVDIPAVFDAYTASLFTSAPFPVIASIPNGVSGSHTIPFVVPAMTLNASFVGTTFHHCALILDLDSTLNVSDVSVTGAIVLTVTN